MIKNLLSIIEKTKLSDKGVTFIESSENEGFLSYQELYTHALKALSFLQNRGLQPKDELVFQIDDNKTFVVVFWACILGGIIPVPLTVGRNDDHRQKLFNVWRILNNPYLIVSLENLQKLKKHADIYGDNELFESIHGKSLQVENIIGDSNKTGSIHYPNEDDIAYIQFSSGSTGSPKGVTLTHKNLITNMKAISEGSKYSCYDSKLSWMPLTHDMGLIGFHLCPMFSGMNHFLLPTNLFIRRPALWLDKASQHQVTILCSPNFGYKYLLKQYNPSNDYQWDLSNVRMIYNGAEPISEEICHEFLNALEGYGLKKTSMYPVYGLAEASLAVSFSKLEEEVISLNIDRAKTQVGETIALKKKSKNTVSFVNVGSSIPYCSIQITDDSNNISKEDVIGHIRIKGDNVTSGYYNNSEATRKTITNDGWLDTGDLGFTHKGSLYVTGRSKDIIFVNGQNYYPHDIERSLEAIDNLELGKVVTAGNTSKVSGGEEIIVFVLHKGKTEKFIEIYNKVKKHINQTFGFEPEHIIPIREIPKTTSGKIQRFKLIEEYALGTFNEVVQEIKDLLVIQQHCDKFIGPTNEIEQKLFEIWSKVLSHNNFGVTQRFFEIGGNSLKGAQVISAIHKEFGVELDYNMLYEKQSIQEIAIEIEQHEIKQYEAIPKIKEQDYYPLSSAQKRLYYLWEVDKSSIAYNIPVAFSINGKFNVEKFKEAIIQVIDRHEVLRASFSISKGEPRQMFGEKVDFRLTITQIDLKNVKNELKKRVKPFDLHKSPLFRIELLSPSNDSYILFLDFHHIISDGVSISLFLEELFKFYRGERLPEIEIQYKDCIYWENKNIESEKLKNQAAYWLKQFNDDIPVLNLPTDFSRPSLMEYHGEKLEFKIDKTLTTNLKRLAIQENTSLFTLFLATYNVLLSKYTGQEDIVTGVPVAGRNHAGLQFLLGMFVNNLAIRSYPQSSLTFKEFLNQLHNASLKALSNQDYPFENLVEQIGQKRDVSRNSLFDTMFIYQNMEFSQCQKDNLSVDQYFFDPGFSKYDISLEVFDQKEEIKFFIEYSTALFKKDTIIRFAKHFDNLLFTIAEKPNTKLSDLSIHSTNEFNSCIIDFNKTKTNYPKDKVIHELIEEQAAKTPDAIAIVMGNTGSELQAEKEENGTRSMTNGEDDPLLPSPFSLLRSLTYKELSDKSNQLANFLRKKGVAPSIPVAIVLERTPELIIAIMGILKAGGCYLPVDRDLPEERIKYILKDSQTKLVISDFEETKNKEIEDTVSRLLSPVSSKSIEYINIFDTKIYSAESTQIENINSPRNLAYIIYTSGTTGNPKGVMVEHQSLVNYASFANKTYIKDEKVSIPLYTSISFDLTVTSIFTPLISGNTIVTYPDNEKSLPLEDVISDNQIHILKATPSHLKMLKEYRTLKEFDYFSNIKRLIVGGEALTTQLAEDIHYIFDGDVEIYNEYGPTEATVGCMIYKYDVEIDKSQTVPIGIPVDNTHIYLLDNYLKPIPVGVAGEMYISGDCLARGYLFNPQLTEDKFIDNPYIINQKMYKTGDLAKRLLDGNIEFIGRVDQQIKINGYRIEIEEIEQQILKCEDVKEVVVMHKDSELIAYIVTDETGDRKQETEDPDSRLLSPVSQSLKHHLSLHLPGYMIPNHIIAIDFVPLTKNGKIDYNLLPSANHNIDVKKEATNDIQKIMVSVWQDVLNENKIGITDNFFELGGDSIKAVQIASRLFDKNISINVKDILTYQTIEQLCLHAEITDGTTQYEQGIVEGEVELNPIQRWFFEQNFENPHFYNQSVLLKFKKPINKEILQKTFEILIKHHDGLRMNYNSEKKVMFYNNRHLEKAFVVEGFNIEPQVASEKLQDEETEDRRQKTEKLNSSFLTSDSRLLNICQQIKGSFNIETTLLIKAAIIKEGNLDLLFITAHHLIIDGVSWRILMEDFYNIYTSLEKRKEIKLPKKTASLIDWNNKLIDFANSEEIKEQIEYWNSNLPSPDSRILSSFSSQFPDSCLPSPINCHRVADLKKSSFQLNEEKTQFLLTDANKPYNTNIEILLVLALVRTLYELTKNEEVVVELESHGRHSEDIDVARTTGWFTSMFPVLFNYKNDLGEQIKQVKEKIRKVPDGGSGYGVLKYFNKSLNDNSRIAEVRFNYLGQFENELNNELFRYEQIDSGVDLDSENHDTAKIVVNAMVIHNELHIEFNSLEEYDNSILKFYKNHLKSIFDYLRNEEDIHFTPVDFAESGVNEQDIDILFE